MLGEFQKNWRPPCVRVGYAGFCRRSRASWDDIAHAGVSSSPVGRIFKESAMPTITTQDGHEIFYKDWGEGPVVSFSHGWPLNADAWDGQTLFLAQQGFRAIAHDRRSAQTATGNDMDGYADDLAALLEALDLRDVTMVGHSTGGGEVARYIGRHSTARVAKGGGGRMDLGIMTLTDEVWPSDNTYPVTDRPSRMASLMPIHRQ
jgi:hypothetical protein